jgi:membrane-anchored glycerophosphoryl diester phosphodiesterase (GDPDase)
MRLTRGSFWRIVLFYIVIAVVSGILSDVLSLLTGLVVSGAPIATRAAIEVLASGVVQIFTSPFILILLTLVYYDIRIRREAFDIEMLAQSL